MYLTDVKAGTSVIIDVERGEERYTLHTKVYEGVANGVSVFAPVHQSTNFTFLSGDKLFVRATVGTRLLQWACDSKELKLVGGIAYLFLYAKSQGVSYNRRNAFRVKYNETVIARSNEDTVQLQLEDISLVGVGFTARIDLQEGDSLSFTLVREGSTIPFTITIVRKYQLEETSNIFFYGATLVHTIEPKLQKLIQELQLIEIRKSRG